MLSLWVVSATTGKGFSCVYLQHFILEKAFIEDAEAGLNTVGRSKKGIMKVGWYIRRFIPAEDLAPNTLLV